MRFSPSEPLALQNLPRQPLRPVTLLVCSVLCSGAFAQDAAEPVAESLALQPSRLLEENISAEQRDQAPTFLQGDRISGRPDLETVIEGDATLRKAGTTIRADRLEYDQPTDQAKATGNVDDKWLASPIGPFLKKVIAAAR